MTRVRLWIEGDDDAEFEVVVDSPATIPAVIHEATARILAAVDAAKDPAAAQRWGET